MKKVLICLAMLLLSLFVQKKVTKESTACEDFLCWLGSDSLSSGNSLRSVSLGWPLVFTKQQNENLQKAPEIKSYGDFAKGKIDKTRETNIFSQQTNKLLPEPQASLLNGILWGEQKRMPKDFYEALRRTGTLHVIALSGMNITILLNILGNVFLIFSRRKAILLSLLTIVIFIWFVGAPPSVVRAGIMGGLSLISVYFGRQDWALLSLILAAGIMLIVNPSWVTDISFQLSFLATLGIIILGGKVIREKGVIGEIKYQLKTDWRTTLAAQVFTMPIILYNFKQLSIVAPLTNVLVLWVVPLIMGLGFVLSVMSLVFYPLAYPLAWIVWVPLTYFIEVVKLTARIPLAQISF